MKTVAKVRLFLPLLALLAWCQPVPAEVAAPEPKYLVEIADVPGNQELASLLTAKGVASATAAKNIWVVNQQSNCAVWIGNKVPLELLRVVLPEAIRVNPYLKFFHVVGDRGEVPPPQVNHTVHVGGNIEAALVKKLNPIDPKELLATLNRVQTLEQLHQYLHEKNMPRPASGAGSAP